MENNYSVYQHVTPDNMYYFGQTNNIKRRWSSNGIQYKGTSLYPYIEKFGWDNIKHIVLFKDQTRENALWIENFLIETAREDGVCINKQRSGLVSKEEGYKQEYDKQYYEQNKDKRLEQKKQYYEQNRDEILEQSRQRYQKNRDEILEQKKQYYEQNRDEILEQKKQYYEQNREKELEQSRQRYQKNRDEINERRRQRYQKNRDEINERRRQRYQKNREKLLEQNREYRKRKKLEKQLKEVVETTLF